MFARSLDSARSGVVVNIYLWAGDENGENPSGRWSFHVRCPTKSRVRSVGEVTNLIEAIRCPKTVKQSGSREQLF